jgi:tripartite ATP-independent transporter DctP family solute receptor
MQLPLLPFLFDSEEQWDEVFQGEIGQQIVANMPEKGIRCLGFDENGYREITTTKKPINSAADMKGLKMRVTSSDIYINTFSSLGCSCQAMTLGEAYSALETGACDGQDNAYNTILSSNIYEVQGYLANTNHILGTMYLCVSEKWYQSLPDDLKQVVEEAAKDACDWQVKTYREQAESDHQALLDAGLQETYPDIDSFKEATQPVYDKFISQYPETEEIINSIKALSK